MVRKILSIIGVVGTVASNLSLIFIKDIPLWLRIIIGIVGIGLLAILAVFLFQERQVNKIVCKSDVEIKAAMRKLIKTQGKVCIVSRDLSWVDSSIEVILKKKGNSLLIFAEKESDLTKRLITNGVNVKYYGDLEYEPKTRFTVLRYNRLNPQVAISNTTNTMRKKDSFKHTIYETNPANQLDSWINSLAIDLIELLNKTSK